MVCVKILVLRISELKPPLPCKIALTIGFRASAWAFMISSFNIFILLNEVLKIQIYV